MLVENEWFFATTEVFATPPEVWFFRWATSNLKLKTSRWLAWHNVFARNKARKAEKKMRLASMLTLLRDPCFLATV